MPAKRLGPRCAESVRHCLDRIGPVLIAHQLLLGARPGTGLAGQPRLPGGFHAAMMLKDLMLGLAGG